MVLNYSLILVSQNLSRDQIERKGAELHFFRELKFKKKQKKQAVYVKL